MIWRYELSSHRNAANECAACGNTRSTPCLQSNEAGVLNGEHLVWKFTNNDAGVHYLSAKGADCMLPAKYLLLQVPKQCIHCCLSIEAQCLFYGLDSNRNLLLWIFLLSLLIATTAIHSHFVHLLFWQQFYFWQLILQPIITQLNYTIQQNKTKHQQYDKKP